MNDQIGPNVKRIVWYGMVWYGGLPVETRLDAFIPLHKLSKMTSCAVSTSVLLHYHRPLIVVGK